VINSSLLSNLSFYEPLIIVTIFRDASRVQPIYCNCVECFLFTRGKTAQSQRNPFFTASVCDVTEPCKLFIDQIARYFSS